MPARGAGHVDLRASGGARAHRADVERRPCLVWRDRRGVALHRPGQADAEWLRRELNGRMRDELLNETLFLSLDHARVVISAWAEDYNQESPHSSLGYETPAAFAAELQKQWPAPLRSTGSAPQAIASSALMRNKAARL